MPGVGEGRGPTDPAPIDAVSRHPGADQRSEHCPGSVDTGSTSPSTAPSSPPPPSASPAPAPDPTPTPTPTSSPAPPPAFTAPTTPTPAPTEARADVDRRRRNAGLGGASLVVSVGAAIGAGLLAHRALRPTCGDANNPMTCEIPTGADLRQRGGILGGAAALSLTGAVMGGLGTRALMRNTGGTSLPAKQRRPHGGHRGGHGRGDARPRRDRHRRRPDDGGVPAGDRGRASNDRPDRPPRDAAGDHERRGRPARRPSASPAPASPSRSAPRRP